MFPLRSAEQPQLPPVERRPFGRTGLQVSALGFGGANIGFTDISHNILDRMFGAALDSGVNLVDTAAMYGDSEEKTSPPPVATSRMSSARLTALRARAV